MCASPHLYGLGETLWPNLDIPFHRKECHTFDLSTSQFRIFRGILGDPVVENDGVVGGPSYPSPGGRHTRAEMLKRHACLSACLPAVPARLLAWWVGWDRCHTDAAKLATLAVAISALKVSLIP